MDFIENIDKFYIELGLIIVFVIGHFIVARKNNLKLTLQYQLYFYGIMMLLLSISIPHIFPSGYPDAILDLENKKRLLYHLQRNREALSKTTEVIREMALLTFLFLVSTISKIIRHFKIDKSVE